MRLLLSPETSLYTQHLLPRPMLGIVLLQRACLVQTSVHVAKHRRCCFDSIQYQSRMAGAALCFLLREAVIFFLNVHHTCVLSSQKGCEVFPECTPQYTLSSPAPAVEATPTLVQCLRNASLPPATTRSLPLGMLSSTVGCLSANCQHTCLKFVKHGNVCMYIHVYVCVCLSVCLCVCERDR